MTALAIPDATTVDLGKLSSQLVKEAEKNPVKAGALGVLTLVALWFWAPLVWGWIRPADSTTPDATQTAAAAPPATGTPAVPATLPLDWQGLVRARQSDPRMAVATWKDNARDPFIAVTVPKIEMEKPTEAVVAAPPPVTKSVSQWNIVLQGVMLGGRANSATISGFTLLEGAKFAIDSQGKLLKKVEPTPGESMTVIELRKIKSTEVVLVSEGKEYVLPLRKRTALTGTIEITRGE